MASRRQFKLAFAAPRDEGGASAPIAFPASALSESGVGSAAPAQIAASAALLDTSAISPALAERRKKSPAARLK